MPLLSFIFLHIQHSLEILTFRIALCLSTSSLSFAIRSFYSASLYLSSIMSFLIWAICSFSESWFAMFWPPLYSKSLNSSLHYSNLVVLLKEMGLIFSFGVFVTFFSISIVFWFSNNLLLLWAKCALCCTNKSTSPRILKF